MSFDNIWEHLKYLGANLSNQNYINKEIKSRLKSENISIYSSRAHSRVNSFEYNVSGTSSVPILRQN
jgi:hypothetical protein